MSNIGKIIIFHRKHESMLNNPLIHAYMSNFENVEVLTFVELDIYGF